MLGLLGQVVRRRTIPSKALAVCAALSSFAGHAGAQVFQTDAARTPLPQPVGVAEASLGTDTWGYKTTTMSWKDPTTGALLDTPLLYGEYYSPPTFPQFVDGDAFALSGLFKWRGEQIDPIADAKTGPGHFLPGCGFEAELVLHGGGCEAALGWYNFNASGAPPAEADIQPLVPKGSTYLNAGGEVLVPRGWDNRDPRDLSRFVWTPRAFSSGDITQNPKYAGGEVAFALLSDPSLQCKATKFSVYEHNAKNASGVPWVTALTYRSKVDASAVYLAFEDLPMSAADWHQAGGQYTNDGDFNDAVFFVSGLRSCGLGGVGNGGSGEGGGAGENGSVSQNGGAPGSAGDGALASGGDGDTIGNPTGSGGGAGESAETAGRNAHAGGDASASGGDANASGGDAQPAHTSSGCSCRMSSQPAHLQISLLGLALSAWVWRRGRSRARSPR